VSEPELVTVVQAIDRLGRDVVAAIRATAGPRLYPCDYAERTARAVGRAAVAGFDRPPRSRQP